MKIFRFSLPFCALVLFLISGYVAASIAVDDWRPVDPGELALKASTSKKTSMRRPDDRLSKSINFPKSKHSEISRKAI